MSDLQQRQDTRDRVRIDAMKLDLDDDDIAAADAKTKELFKQAVNEWLDDKVTQLAWWSIKRLAALAIAALLGLLLYTYGFRKQ